MGLTRRTGWRSPSTSTTSSSPSGWARPSASTSAMAKVGLELYSAVGPDAITAMVDLGFTVFADIKLHDIPTTVRRAAACVFGALGADYLNLHAAGGERDAGRRRRGARRRARRRRPARPVALAVTVLTSDGEAAADAPAGAGPGGGGRRDAAASCAPSPTSRRSEPSARR